MKKALCLLLSVLMVLSLAACGESPAATTTEGAQAEKRTDLNMIIQVEPDALDPMVTTMQYASQINQNIYATLVERAADGSIVPGIAELPTVDESGKVYTFKLKEGVKFQNGETLTADDIVFTFERGMNHPKKPTDYAMIESVKAVSDLEVAITLKTVNAAFLSSLVKPQMGMLNRKATEAAGDDYTRNPVGCGPYKLKEWKSGEYVLLEAFDDYYKGAPEIKNVKIKFVGDTNTALIALQSGDADFSYVYPPASAEDIEADDKLSMVNYNATSLQVFTFNTKCEKLSDKRVRQAINYALNRDDVVVVAAEGKGVATTQYVNAETFGYLEGKEGYTYDPEKAKSLLAEAGYADGFTVKVVAQDAMTSKMCTVLADNLKEVGITCEIEMQESNTAIANFQSGNYEIGVFGLNNAQMDFDFMFKLFDYEGTLCMCQAKDENIKKQFQESVMLTDNAARLESIAKLMDDIWDAAYYMPVYFPQRAVVMSSGLTIDCMRGSGLAEIYEMHWK